MPDRHLLAAMLRGDLDEAGIDYQDSDGRFCDFHSLRHTFITNLANGGVHPKLAQDLARHSDINLTLSCYSHSVLGDRSNALRVLPDLSGPAVEPAKKSGTFDAPLNAPTRGSDRLALCLAQKQRRDATSLDSYGPETRGEVKTKNPEFAAENAENPGLSAEREGFEPTVPRKGHTGFRNRPDQPLRHLSESQFSR